MIHSIRYLLTLMRALPLATTATLAVFLACASVKAQPTTGVFASGLRAPTKIIFSQKGNLLVAEAGNGPNTGRISIVDLNGNLRTLIDGLPSGFAPPNDDPSGPSGLAMRGRTFYVVIGSGDTTLAGPAPATEIPNPNPSSPFLSSVLSMRLSPQSEETTQGFTMSFADQLALQSRGYVRLTDVDGNELLIELVTNFPNFTFEPRPNFAGNVRPSNPFGIVIRGKTLYVVDASQNLVYNVDSDTGETSIQIRLPPKLNPLFPALGPPLVDPVPDSIRLVGRSLLVSYLTGFPFAPGTAEVRKVRLVNNSNEPFISGLTSAIDVLPVEVSKDQFQFFTLEFSTAQLMGAPGRLSRFDQPAGPPVVLVDNLTTPTSLTRDPVSGDLFVTEIFTGRIIRVQPPSKGH